MAGKFHVGIEQQPAAALARDGPGTDALPSPTGSSHPDPARQLPSTTILSTPPPPKSNAYVLLPALCTFISSGILLCDGMSLPLADKRFSQRPSHGGRQPHC